MHTCPNCPRYPENTGGSPARLNAFPRDLGPFRGPKHPRADSVDLQGVWDIFSKSRAGAVSLRLEKGIWDHITHS
jgi:hypothetical protein